MARLQASSASSPERMPLPTRSSRTRAPRTPIANASSTSMKDIEDSVPRFSQQETTLIKANLLRWYDAHHRKLPWRHEPAIGLRCPMQKDELLELQQSRAYSTWVSEVMLQQTRVATVIDYFNRWMQKWPTIQALAAATEEEVFTLWAGLGYYRRARFLHEGAKQIVQSYGGFLPPSADQLQKIPGIGKYTAGAIASIAFGEPVPLVDGNVIRVLCRLKTISDSPKAASTKKTLWSLAEQLVDAKRPGDFNQGLMELGATTCSVTSPGCASCPLQKNCEAYALHQKMEHCQNATRVTDFPVKVAKPARRQEHVAVCILEKSVLLREDLNKGKPRGTDTYFLLVKRPKKGLLAGLWEFPSASLEDGNASLKKCKAAIDQYFEKTLGLQFSKDLYIVEERETLGTFVHEFTHIRMHMTIEWMHILADNDDESLVAEIKDLKGIEARWVLFNELEEFGLTSGVKKAYQMLLAFRKGEAVPSRKAKRKRSSDAEE